MITQSVFFTMKCDGTCGKPPVTFAQEDQDQAARDNPWINELRTFIVVDPSQHPQQPPQKRTLHFCSDECVIDAAGAGALAPRRIISGNESDQKLAQLAAQRAQAATAALKQGSGVTLG